VTRRKAPVAPVAPVAPAQTPDPGTVEVMRHLVRAAGRDPDALLAALGCADWSQASRQTVHELIGVAVANLFAGGTRRRSVRLAALIAAELLR